jgi:hypothetical protein
LILNFKPIYQNRLVLPIKNLSDSDTNNASFSFYAVCVPRDSDGDGITDDLDDRYDGIPDSIEAQGNNLITFIYRCQS